MSYIQDYQNQGVNHLGQAFTTNSVDEYCPVHKVEYVAFDQSTGETLCNVCIYDKKSENLVFNAVVAKKLQEIYCEKFNQYRESLAKMQGLSSKLVSTQLQESMKGFFANLKGHIRKIHSHVINELRSSKNLIEINQILRDAEKFFSLKQTEAFKSKRDSFIQHLIHGQFTTIAINKSHYDDVIKRLDEESAKLDTVAQQTEYRMNKILKINKDDSLIQRKMNEIIEKCMEIDPGRSKSEIAQLRYLNQKRTNILEKVQVANVSTDSSNHLTTPPAPKSQHQLLSKNKIQQSKPTQQTVNRQNLISQSNMSRLPSNFGSNAPQYQQQKPVSQRSVANTSQSNNAILQQMNITQQIPNVVSSRSNVSDPRANQYQAQKGASMSEVVGQPAVQNITPKTQNVGLETTQNTTHQRVQKRISQSMPNATVQARTVTPQTQANIQQRKQLQQPQQNQQVMQHQVPQAQRAPVPMQNMQRLQPKQLTPAQILAQNQQMSSQPQPKPIQNAISQNVQKTPPQTTSKLVHPKSLEEQKYEAMVKIADQKGANQPSMQTNQVQSLNKTISDNKASPVTTGIAQKASSAGSTPAQTQQTSNTSSQGLKSATTNQMPSSQLQQKCTVSTSAQQVHPNQMLQKSPAQVAQNAPQKSPVTMGQTVPQKSVQAIAQQTSEKVAASQTQAKKSASQCKPQAAPTSETKDVEMTDDCKPSTDANQATSTSNQVKGIDLTQKESVKQLKSSMNLPVKSTPVQAEKQVPMEVDLTSETKKSQEAPMEVEKPVVAQPTQNKIPNAVKTQEKTKDISQQKEGSQTQIEAKDNKPQTSSGGETNPKVIPSSKTNTQPITSPSKASEAPAKSSPICTQAKSSSEQTTLNAKTSESERKLEEEKKADSTTAPKDVPQLKGPACTKSASQATPQTSTEVKTSSPSKAPLESKPSAQPTPQTELNTPSPQSTVAQAQPKSQIEEEKISTTTTPEKKTTTKIFPKVFKCHFKNKASMIYKINEAGKMSEVINMKDVILPKLVYTTDNKVFLIGGAKDTTVKDTVDTCYEVSFTGEKPQVVKKASMPVAKASFGCTLSQDHKRIYTAGGYKNDNEVIKSAEFYDIEKDTWTSLPEMVNHKVSSALCEYTASDGTKWLYSFGGLYKPSSASSVQLLAKIERINLDKADKWEELSLSFPEKICDSGCMQIDSKTIMIFGGWNQAPYKSVHLFQPEKEVKTIISCKAEEQLQKPDFFLSNGLAGRVSGDSDIIRIGGHNHTHEFNMTTRKFRTFSS